MYLFNQKYWGKMARKELLINGDRYSHFFHQSMKTRKTRTKILELKDVGSNSNKLSFLLYFFLSHIELGKREKMVFILLLLLVLIE